MIRDQLFLFPELDSFKTIIKDIDYMDVSEIPEFKNVVPTKNKLSGLPKGKFFLFKNGGSNRFLPELGKIFPYVQNMDTKHVYAPTHAHTQSKTSVHVDEYTKLQACTHTCAHTKQNLPCT